MTKDTSGIEVELSAGPPLLWIVWFENAWIRMGSEMHRDAPCQGKWSNQRRRYSERLADTARRPAPSLANAGRPCWRRPSCHWYQLETAILSDSHLHLKFHHHALEEQTRDPGTDSKTVSFQTFGAFQPLGIFEICQEFMWPYLNDWRRNWQQFLGRRFDLILLITAIMHVKTLNFWTDTWQKCII